MRHAIKADCASFKDVAKSVCAEASRNIELLRAIEAALENVAGLRTIFGGMEEGIRAVEQQIRALRPEVELDPNDEFASKFMAAQDACVRTVQRLRGCAESARRDPDLTDEDGVAEAFDSAADAAVSLHDAYGDLLFVLQQHDGLVSEVAGGPFTSAEELISFLRG